MPNAQLDDRGGATTDGDAVNRYRLSLARALPVADTQATDVREAFRAARRALEGGAWDGPVADAFAAELGECIAAGTRAADDCERLLAAQHRQEPPQVPHLDRRATFTAGVR